LPDIKAPCNNLDELLSLDEALDRLENESPDDAKLVKLLYFAGLNLDEAAQVMCTSRTTAYRRWKFARAWLYAAISGEEHVAGICPPGGDIRRSAREAR
jgi:DNA-directed RNA polymerase specialized sigma24 family protein